MLFGRASIMLLFLRVMNSGLGFLFGLLLAIVFGASKETDALLVAMAVPVMLSRDIAGGIVGALVPCLVEDDERADASGFLQTFILVSFVATVVLMLGVNAGARWIVALTAPGFDAAEAEYTTNLFRLLLPSMMLFLLFGGIQSFLYAKGRLFVPELGQLAWRIVAIGSVCVLGRKYGVPALAAGVTCAAIIQFLIVASIGHRCGYALGTVRWASIDIRVLRPFLKGAGVIAAAIGLGEVESALDRIAMSFLPDGAFSHYSYAWRLSLQMPLMISISLQLPLLPGVARMNARLVKGGENIIRLVAFHMGVIGFLMGCLVFWAADDIVNILLLHGKFDTHSATVVSAAMRTLAAAVPALMMAQTLKGFYFVRRGFKTIVAAGLLGIVIHALGNLVFWRMGAPGMGVSLSCAAWGSMLFLWRVTRAEGREEFHLLPGMTVCIVLPAVLFLLPWSQWIPSAIARPIIGAALTAGLYLLVMRRAVGKVNERLHTAISGSNDGRGNSAVEVP